MLSCDEEAALNIRFAKRVGYANAETRKYEARVPHSCLPNMLLIVVLCGVAAESPPGTSAFKVNLTVPRN